ncbi:hypothetical protein SAMN02799630_02763 [Paenibacillus sp. UNCCL117]|nr:hypothetical protein SAMN02799630_02763 [Paenibacillus sp. UNCCL117]
MGCGWKNVQNALGRRAGDGLWVEKRTKCTRRTDRSWDVGGKTYKMHSAGGQKLGCGRKNVQKALGRRAGDGMWAKKRTKCTGGGGRRWNGRKNVQNALGGRAGVGVWAENRTKGTRREVKRWEVSEKPYKMHSDGGQRTGGGRKTVQNTLGGRAEDGRWAENRTKCTRTAGKGWEGGRKTAQNALGARLKDGM